MFANTENKVNLYEAMNQGKIVLINTSKSVLGKLGSQIMGKFFLAMLTQSALKRAAISENDRKPFHIYVDEASDYADEIFCDFISQTRKYKVGFHLFHQDFGQLTDKIRSSVLASTAIKFAGGVSAQDARILENEMNTDRNTILSAEKLKRKTQFCLHVQNITKKAVIVEIKMGLLEREPVMTAEDYGELIDRNRQKYCKHISEIDLNNDEYFFVQGKQKTEEVIQEIIEHAPTEPIEIPPVIPEQTQVYKALQHEPEHIEDTTTPEVITPRVEELIEQVEKNKEVIDKEKAKK